MDWAFRDQGNRPFNWSFDWILMNPLFFIETLCSKHRFRANDVLCQIIIVAALLQTIHNPKIHSACNHLRYCSKLSSLFQQYDCNCSPVCPWGGTSLGSDYCSKMLAEFSLWVCSRGRKFGSGYIPRPFTNTNNLAIATVGQKKDWSPCDLYGWITVSWILETREDSLTFSVALSLRVS